MKSNFKFIAIAALGLILGFSSCAKDNGGDTVPVGKKKVNIRMSFAGGSGGSSRAEGTGSADGKTPNFNDLALVFVGNGVVQHVAELTNSDQTALENGKAFTVPTAVSKVYAVGNYGDKSSPSLPTEGDPVATVEKMALEVNLQTDYMDVNLSAGQMGTKGGTAYTGASFGDVGGVETAALKISPAFARYEINKVSVNASAEQPLKSFKLTGIYITNTYRTIGLDYASVATAAEDIFNYGPGTASFDTSVKAYHKDTWANASRTAASEFVPETVTGSTIFWHYMLVPPIAGKGTILFGNTERESSVPIIVLKIEDAEADDTKGNNADYAKVNYITVRRLIESGETEPLTYLRPGYVYKIANIAFGGEHLTENPGDNTEKSVTVQVEFHPWIGSNVNPDL